MTKEDQDNLLLEIEKEFGKKNKLSPRIKAILKQFPYRDLNHFLVDLFEKSLKDGKKELSAVLESVETNSGKLRKIVGLINDIPYKERDDFHFGMPVSPLYNFGADTELTSRYFSAIEKLLDGKAAASWKIYGFGEIIKVLEYHEYRKSSPAQVTSLEEYVDFMSSLNNPKIEELLLRGPDDFVRNPEKARQAIEVIKKNYGAINNLFTKSEKLNSFAQGVLTFGVLSPVEEYLKQPKQKKEGMLDKRSMDRLLKQNIKKLDETLSKIDEFTKNLPSQLDFYLFQCFSYLDDTEGKLKFLDQVDYFKKIADLGYFNQKFWEDGMMNWIFMSARDAAIRKDMQSFDNIVVASNKCYPEIMKISEKLTDLDEHHRGDTFTNIMTGLGVYTGPVLREFALDFDKDNILRLAENFGRNNLRQGATARLKESNFKIEGKEQVQNLLSLVDLIYVADILKVWEDEKNIEGWKQVNQTDLSKAYDYVSKVSIESASAKFGFSEESAEKIVKHKNAKEILSGIALVADKTGMTPVEFYGIFGGEELGFKGSKEKRNAFHVIDGLTSAYYDFNKSAMIVPNTKVDVDASIEEVNKKLYQDGLILLKEIQSGNIEFIVGDGDEEVESYIERKKEYTQEIKKLFKENRADEAKSIIEEKKNVEKELTELMKSRIVEQMADFGIKPEAQPSIDNLKEYLSQVSQHNLVGKPQERAKNIARSLVVTENSIDSDVLKLSVWDKTMENMPTYQEYRCCGFVGYSTKDGETFAYMANPSVQLLQLEVGSKKGMAITAATKDKDGKPILLVDSVESGTHIFSRADVAKAAAEAIEDYARAAGFSKVIYSTDAGNNAPHEFLRNLGEMGYKSGKRKLKMMTAGPEVFLEAELDSASGYITELR